MKQKDLALIIVFAVIAAAVSFVISGAIIKPPAGSTKVPVIMPIDPNFPDAKNDSKYSTIFNSQALDPTQPVQIGSQNNTIPFR